MQDLISRQVVADTRRYTFGNDEFSLESAYHDCKLVFDGITDDDSFQEADTGLILYYANEIIYALQEALAKDTNVPSNDVISRQAAMDALDNIKIPRNASWYPYYQQALTVMSRLPSAQPYTEAEIQKMQDMEQAELDKAFELGKQAAQPEPHEIGYSECANSTLKMWIDNVLTDGEYSHIMDKLNAYWAERKTDEQTD